MLKDTLILFRKEHNLWKPVNGWLSLMPFPSQTALEDRLKAYFTVLRSSSRAAVKYTADNWQLYATVTGSALAMGTNASASVIYSGIQNVTVSIASIGPSGGMRTTSVRHDESAVVHLEGTHWPAFVMSVFQRIGSYGSLTGNAGVRNRGVHFLVVPSVGLKLGSGARISSLAGRFLPGYAGSGISHWTTGKTAFAGFKFTSGTNPTDYGWVRLVYTVSGNGEPNSITAIDWAWGPGPISAGETSSAPEPSTAGLAVLAIGAAGVAALRRRRKASEITAAV
jgi:MYXO-CTERM domain-containing protein